MIKSLIAEVSFYTFCFPLTALLLEKTLKTSRFTTQLLLFITLLLTLNASCLLNYKPISLYNTVINAVHFTITSLPHLLLICLILGLIYYGEEKQFKITLSKVFLKNCILAPINEELLYRKILVVNILYSKHQFSILSAITFGSIMFSIAHLPTNLHRTFYQCCIILAYTFLFALVTNCILFKCNTTYIQQPGAF